VAKSNRKRKRDRAVRHAKSARKQTAVQARREQDDALRQAVAARRKVHDPQAPPGDVASWLSRTYEGSPVPPGLTQELVSSGSTPERLAQIAEALRAAEQQVGRDQSLTYLTFSAGAAYAAGHDEQAARLLHDALSAADSLDDEDEQLSAQLQVLSHMRGGDWVAQVAELTEARLRRDPWDDDVAEQYASAITQAFRLVAADGPAAHPREQAALDRFADRSHLGELQDAVATYIRGSRFRTPIEDSVAGWLSVAEGWDPHERAALAVLVEEQAQVVTGDSPDGTTTPPEGDPEYHRGPLWNFARSPGVPADVAERALAWHEYVHYGLWQVADPNPAPGVECIDIASGVTRYVEFPAEMIERLPRWGVFYGAVVPVDGIWRSTGNAVQLSPSEADAIAETLMDALDGLARDIAGESSKRAFRRAREPVPFGQAGPHNVLAYQADELPLQTVHLMGYVACSLLPRLTVDLHEHRTAPPVMLNSDGDPMNVINARIGVRDAATLAGRLADHADFRAHEDDPVRLDWLGRAIAEHQRATMAADLRAELEADESGLAGLLDDDGPRRWLRGQVEIRDGELIAEVNSEERLTRLLRVLAKLGEDPSVIDETRVDAAQDFAWSAGPRAFPRGAAPAESGWEKHWLDEPVPALRGRTPRQVTESDGWPVIEGVLRQFEYEADILAASGQSGVDTAYLRAELHLPSDPWDLTR
jgi:hypothetical protein